MFDGTVGKGMADFADKIEWKLYRRSFTSCFWTLKHEIWLKEHIEVIEHQFELNKK